MGSKGRGVLRGTLLFLFWGAATYPCECFVWELGVVYVIDGGCNGLEAESEGDGQQGLPCVRA